MENFYKNLGNKTLLLIDHADLARALRITGKSFDPSKLIVTIRSEDAEASDPHIEFRTSEN